MTERQWNALLNRHINGGEVLKELCTEYGEEFNYSTAKKYKKRYLQQNSGNVYALPPINNNQNALPTLNNNNNNTRQNIMLPNINNPISPTPTQGLFKKPKPGRGDAVRVAVKSLNLLLNHHAMIG
jgi:hypothetical protein